jgi:hypothetical protein
MFVKVSLGVAVLLVSGFTLLGVSAARTPHAAGTGPNGRCPIGARELPAAGVIHAAGRALAEASRDYSQLNTEGAEVMAADRVAFAGVRGEEVARQCGARVAARTVIVQMLFPHMLPSASLSEAVVAVSRFRDGYRVWEILH